MSVWCRVLAGCLALLVPALDAAAEPEVGKTVAAIREAGGTPAGGTRVALRDGDAVLFREVLDTGVASALQARFLDDTILSMGASSRLTLSEFVYDPNGTSNSAFISLAKGTFTFIAGKVAKTGDMKVDTPVATMGIRGTAPHVEISEDGAVHFATLVEEEPTQQKQPGTPAQENKRVAPAQQNKGAVPPEQRQRQAKNVPSAATDKAMAEQNKKLKSLNICRGC